MKKEQFTITGMTCSACSARVEKAVAKVDGTKDVSVNLLTNSMQLEYDEAKTSVPAIIKAVVDAGYGASVKGKQAAAKAAPQEDPVKKSIDEMKHRLVWSIAFLLPTMYISMHGLFEKLFGLPVPQIVGAVFDGPQNAIVFAFSQFLLVLPIMYLNRRYYIAGFRNLFRARRTWTASSAWVRWRQRSSAPSPSSAWAGASATATWHSCRSTARISTLSRLA